MSIDVRKTTTPPVTIVPGELRAALDSATCRVVSPANVEIATPTCTVDTVSATVSAVANGTEIDLDDSTGFVAGRSYLLLAQAGPEIVVVERVDSSEDRLYLATRTSDLVRVGDTIVGAQVSTTLTAPCTATLDLNYRIEWTITDTDGNEYALQTMYHVVEMTLPPLATPRAVRKILLGYSGDAMIDRFGVQVIREIAEKADDRLRQMIERIGRRPHLYGDASQFSQAADEAIHVTLASAHTLTPASFEGGPAEWQRQKMKAFQSEFDMAVQRLGWYDEEETREPEGAPRPQWSTSEILA